MLRIKFIHVKIGIFEEVLLLSGGEALAEGSELLVRGGLCPSIGGIVISFLSVVVCGVQGVGWGVCSFSP